MQGQNVPDGAGALQLTLAPVSVSVPLPEGSYAGQWVEVKLPGQQWLKEARQSEAKDPKETPETRKAGLVLPGFAEVRIAYKGKTGEVVLEQAELLETRDPGPNLAANASFEEVDADGYPTGWSRPVKYRYFPPKYYYIFNTWHNSQQANRGPVEADTLIVHGGRRSLKMIVASGDEKCVVSEPITLNQKQPRLIEVQVWVRHDKLAMLQINAEDDKGQHLDGFRLHPEGAVLDRHGQLAFAAPGLPPPSAGQQHPRQTVRSRGQRLHPGRHQHPTAEQRHRHHLVGRCPRQRAGKHPPELTERGVKPPSPAALPAPLGPTIEGLDLGERKIGENTLAACPGQPGPGRGISCLVGLHLVNPGPAG